MQKRNRINLYLGASFVSFFLFTGHVSANVVYSQLDDSVEIGTSFANTLNAFTDATGHPTEVRVSYNDKGNSTGHFIGIGIVDIETGVHYYGYKSSVSTSCGSTFESQGLNTKQILTFDTTWQWPAYPCTGSNLVFNPNHHYYLEAFRNTGGGVNQVFYGSSSNPKDYYAYVENDTTFHDSQKSIVSFSFPNLANGVVDEVSRIISLHVPFGTDVSSVATSITVSDGATISPNSGVVQNFNDHVTYTVTAVDGSTKKYKVKVLIDCNLGCESHVLYSQLDNSIEITQNSIFPYQRLAGVSGRISNFKFSYNDHGDVGNFIGVGIYDYVENEYYYTSLNGVCGDAYESKGVNTKIIVTLDSSMTYRKYPCNGPNLELNPTHTYGISVFRNHGGNDLHKFYGSSDYDKNAYLYIESHSATTTPQSCTVNCFSNVLFIPGIMGSKLYEEINSSEKELWVSIFDSNHAELSLDINGKSVGSVYTKDDTQSINDEAETGITDEIIGFNIYNSFINDLRNWKEEEVIKDYAFIPYDWRLSLEDIITNGATTTGNKLSYTNTQNFSESYIVKKLSDLQKNSKSGKVTIIAHSNGGLVTKALIQKLKDTNNPLYEKIDKIIFVAVPQVGTPDAISALLHGSELANGLLMNQDRGRQLSLNMPAIYNLLPSTGYFTTVDPAFAVDKVVSFENDPIFQAQLSQYGVYVSNSTELKNYILGTDSRVKPSYSDVDHPDVGNSTLYSNAQAVHQVLDSWQPASTTKVIQVAGWGEETLAGLDYVALKDFYGTEYLSYEPRFVVDGDGTVVVPSALWMSTVTSSVERWWVDLDEYNSGVTINRIHRDILEIPNLLNFVKSQIQGSVFVDSENIVINNTSTLVSNDTRLHYTLHSPLTLGVTDSQGRYTGEDPLTHETRDEIPNVIYKKIGGVGYISIPKDISHTLKLSGYETGSFALDIDEQTGNTVANLTSFQGIPSSSSTIVTMNFNPNINIASSTLDIDRDGNGVTDVSLNTKVGGVVTMPKYKWQGFLQPIDDTKYHPEQTSSVFKTGSTVPVKFQLKDLDGNIIQAPVSPKWLGYEKLSTLSLPVDESVFALSATTGSDFKWDTTSKQYIYNWSTKGLNAGYWYKLSVRLDDGYVYTVVVGLK